MANIITAGNSTNGGTAITTDTSGTLNIVTGSGSGATAITVDGSQNVTFANAISVTGNATITGTLTATGGVTNSLRAWVNFNGTGTPAIRASGNVSSITDNGTGDYTVNFTTAMPDANYAIAYIADSTLAGGSFHYETIVSAAASNFRLLCSQINSGVTVCDPTTVRYSIFR
jgi:hypothetical protein